MLPRFIAVNDYDEIVVSTDDEYGKVKGYVDEVKEGENEETYGIYVLVEVVLSELDKLKTKGEPR